MLFRVWIRFRCRVRVRGRVRVRLRVKFRVRVRVRFRVRFIDLDILPIFSPFFKFSLTKSAFRAVIAKLYIFKSENFANGSIKIRNCIYNFVCPT